MQWDEKFFSHRKEKSSFVEQKGQKFLVFRDVYNVISSC